LVQGLTFGAIALLACGGYGHYAQRARAASTQVQERAMRPLVRTLAVAPSTSATAIELPGTTEAFDIAAIYPRASGYIAKRIVDIGSRVKKGDLLAVIESPELDRQIGQAQAQLIQSQAALKQSEVNLRLAHITAERYAALAAKNYATQQEADNYRLAEEARDADVKSAQATVAAHAADLQRLRQLAGYERVEAPFDGVIIDRNVNVGDLSNADSGNLIASGKSLFTEALDDTLRIHFDVPQSDAIGISDGLQALISVPEIPGRSFVGRITRSADALDATTRTMRVEVDLDNHDHMLKSGLYVTVRIEIPRSTPAISIPSEALIFDHDGTQVATVVDGRIVLKRVQVVVDHGATVDLAGGLQAGEQLVLNPFADIADGREVDTDSAKAG
jgi:RND family efflux transporter MFP subunit